MRELQEMLNEMKFILCFFFSFTTEEENKLHDRIDILENHLEVCDILSRYNCHRSVKFISENEENEIVGKQLMEDMAQHRRT